jgi:hypothetical protein
MSSVQFVAKFLFVLKGLAFFGILIFHEFIFSTTLSISDSIAFLTHTAFSGLPQSTSNQSTNT